MSETILVELDEDIGQRLKQRARQRGQTLQRVTQDILSEAIRSDPSIGPANELPPSGLGTRIARRFEGLGFEEADFPEWKGHVARDLTSRSDPPRYQRPVGIDRRPSTT